MSLAKFRNLNPETKKKSSPKANQDQKLSFRKLAARDSHVVTDRPAVKTRSKAVAVKKRNIFFIFIVFSC